MPLNLARASLPGANAGFKPLRASGPAMVQIFGVNVSEDAFFTALQAAIIIVATVVIARLIHRLFKTFDEKPSEASSRAARNLGRILQVIVYTIGLLAIGATLDIDISSLVIGLGTVSIAISFALSTLINNLVAGFLIQADGSVRIGDNVSLGDIQGRVVRMRTRATMLVTKEGALVFVPNAYFMANPLVNRGRDTSGPDGPVEGH